MQSKKNADDRMEADDNVVKRNGDDENMKLFNTKNKIFKCTEINCRGNPETSEIAIRRQAGATTKITSGYRLAQLSSS